MMMCKEATRLMPLKQDRPLSFQERVSLRFHLAMCRACRECDKQFTLLHEAGRRLGARPDNDQNKNEDKGDGKNNGAH